MQSSLLNLIVLVISCLVKESRITVRLYLRFTRAGYEGRRLWASETPAGVSKFILFTSIRCTNWQLKAWTQCVRSLASVVSQLVAWSWSPNNVSRILKWWRVRCLKFFPQERTLNTLQQRMSAMPTVKWKFSTQFPCPFPLVIDLSLWIAIATLW